MNKTVKPQGVCCSEINIEYTDTHIVDVRFTGGCQGNLEAIRKLIIGKPIKEISNILLGIDCHGKGTSCADQLAKFLVEILEEG